MTVIGGRLTMRAAVERNGAAGTDSWGNPVPAVFGALATFNCFAWSKQTRELVDGTQQVTIEDARAMFALGTDITENDEIASITDRQGNVVFPGRFRVDGPPQHKHNHIEVALQRIG